jgi:hypothetical protein
MWSGVVVSSRVSSASWASRDPPWAEGGKDHLVNPDDARPTGVITDAATNSVTGPGVTGVPGPGVAEQGGPQRRELSFRTSGLRIELEITGSSESRRLAGRLIPAQSAVVEIRGVITVEADAAGRFTADAVPPGQVSLRCRLGTETDHARLATGWVAI